MKFLPLIILTLFTFSGLVFAEENYDEDLLSITYYDQILEIDPLHIDALKKKGDALATLGQYESALTSFQKILVVDPHLITNKLD